MKRTKIIGIALVIGYLLLIGINNNSYSDEITSLSASAYVDYGSGGDVWASLSADTDIYFISFSVKQTYPVDDADSDWTIVYSNMYATGKRSVSFEHLGTVDGSLKIAEYSLKAEVWFYDADGNPTNNSDDETTTFSVSKTLSTTVPTETQKYPDVSGYAGLSGQYYSGGDIVMSCSVSAYNPLEITIYAAQSISIIRWIAILGEPKRRYAKNRRTEMESTFGKRSALMIPKGIPVIQTQTPG